MVGIFALLGISGPALALWASVLAILSAVGAGFNAWYGTMDWVTFGMLAVCVGLALVFFVAQRPWLLFLVAAALVAAAWTYSSHEGYVKGLAQGKLEGVKLLQTAIGVKADGYYGADTKAAVEKFKDAASQNARSVNELRADVRGVQAALGVTPDGSLGSETLGAIEKLKAAADQAPLRAQIKQVQAALGIEADGYIGVATLTAIDALKNKPCEIAHAPLPEVMPKAAPTAPKATPKPRSKTPPRVTPLTPSAENPALLPKCSWKGTWPQCVW